MKGFGSPRCQMSARAGTRKAAAAKIYLEVISFRSNELLDWLNLSYGIEPLNMPH